MESRSSPQRGALVAIAFAIFIETIDVSSISLALPSIATSFGVAFPQVQWVVLASVLTQATLSLVIGWFGDVYGNKRILVTGLVLTGLGNLLCTVSPSLAWLIAARIVQGVGLTMAGALILAIVTETFAARDRGKAFGFIGTMVSIGIVVGPLAGGLILEVSNWRVIFIFDLLFVLCTIPLALRFIVHAPEAGHRPFDYVGALTFFISLLAFLLASTATDPGPSTLWLYVLAGASLATFVLHEMQTRHAMLNLNLFRTGAFSVYLATRYIVFMVFGGIALILPFYLETMLGLEPATVGVLLAIQPCFFGAGSWVSGQLVERIGRRPLILAALVLLAAAYYWLSFLSFDFVLWQFACQMVLAGIGLGMLPPPSNSIIFSSAHQKNLGMISSLTALVRIHSRSLGIAVLGGIWVYLTRVRTPLQTGTALSGELAAQLESFAAVCVIAALIVLATLVLCSGETLVYRRQQARQG